MDPPKAIILIGGFTDPSHVKVNLWFTHARQSLLFPFSTAHTHLHFHPYIWLPVANWHIQHFLAMGGGACDSSPFLISNRAGAWWLAVHAPNAVTWCPDLGLTQSLCSPVRLGKRSNRRAKGIWVYAAGNGGAIRQTCCSAASRQSLGSHLRTYSHEQFVTQNCSS